MFSRVWAEHEASEIRLLDDVEAILLVLRIARLRLQDLPKKGALPLQDLLSLFVVCGKYDLVHFIRPFLDLKSWALPWFPNLTAGLSHAELLFVAWTFGFSESFKALANKLVLQMTMTVAGVPMVYGKHFPEAMPPGLLSTSMVAQKTKSSSDLRPSLCSLEC